MSPRFLTWSKPASRATLAHSLAHGSIAITSSDTVLGFLAPVTLEGFKKLDSLKQRENKPYLIVMADKSKLNHFIDLPLSAGLQRMIDSCWPGPVTLIFKARESLPSYVKGPDGTVALRVPQHAGLLDILKDMSGLFSTSANLHGQPIPETVSDIDPKILQAVACVVTDESEKKQVIPSTILDCTQVQVRVVREGAYAINELEALYGAPFLKPLTK
ncbi:MAG: L-threonylcarbamoyladenylate synthase [Candidatus Babeliales bacterium]